MNTFIRLLTSGGRAGVVPLAETKMNSDIIRHLLMKLMEEKMKIRAQRSRRWREVVKEVEAEDLLWPTLKEAATGSQFCHLNSSFYSKCISQII